MVKNSLSSTINTSISTTTSGGHRHHPVLGFRMLVVLFFLIASVAGCLSAELPRKNQGQIIMSRRNNHHRPCDSFSHAKPRSLCNQFHSNNRRNRSLPPPPLPPSRPGEIDPRYGVEKRLVPSGPNPLHN
ncbi:hypothetical protein PanWU01x14_008760 [Parasponia andersonii]|uniref:CLAVATA3/ESR (CLE)-related protein n=1 Tax=Parasponia andersonii TaxID=3476 RepID=A0A2P5E275_PARAD|nr:hypothetical protein PanWU01x14_008760 [Parasponia andersonii]